MSVVIQVPPNTTAVYIYEAGSNGEAVLRSMVRIATTVTTTKTDCVAAQGTNRTGTPEIDAMLLPPKERPESGKHDGEEACKNMWGKHATAVGSEKPFACDICGSRFTTRPHAKTHFLMVHCKEKPHACNTCDAKFAKSHQLARHVTNQHDGVKPFACDVCGKNFAQRGHYNVHMKRHRGVRPYPCNYCDKRFKDRSGLVQHAQCHTGEKRFACHVCDRAFFRRNQHTAHMRLHTHAATEVERVVARQGQQQEPKTSLDIGNGHSVSNGDRIALETLLEHGIQWPLEETLLLNEEQDDTYEWLGDDNVSLPTNDITEVRDSAMSTASCITTLRATCN